MRYFRYLGYLLVEQISHLGTAFLDASNEFSCRLHPSHESCIDSVVPEPTSIFGGAIAVLDEFGRSLSDGSHIDFINPELTVLDTTGRAPRVGCVLSVLSVPNGSPCTSSSSSFQSLKADSDSDSDTDENAEDERCLPRLRRR